MPPKPKLNVHSFPRPPLLQKTPRHLQIKWKGELIADTKDTYWVLETTHPPTYYLPPSSVLAILTQTSKTSLCEWKGQATYYSIASGSETVKDRIWSYNSPTPGFKPINGYLSFYAGPWDCYVDGELVTAQPGDFYGGWMTNDIEGKVKGGPGTWGW
ncbi:DUF427-domain-containing protein [Athelia psychrophila]|uniref:DUF427-domain-containing protein n=1 Tax=Athelia psychrophila TaxID=1759441 RepID=A0A166VYU0_9AGAM|nr:DUF427-domain-containing protein [Fibularhizoctonia sp. CBS 109695]